MRVLLAFTNLSWVGVAIHHVLRAPRVRCSPVEVKLLQPVVVSQGPTTDPWKQEKGHLCLGFVWAQHCERGGGCWGGEGNRNILHPPPPHPPRQGGL